MVKTNEQRAKRALWLAIGGVTLLRLFIAPHTQLLPEEAYYWTYAKHPSLGYFDHPPMVAWCVGLGTHLLGDTQLGVRFVNLLLWIATCLLLLQTGKLWFEERVAVGAALLYVTLPVFNFIGFLVTPDGPLLFFWMLTLYALSRALQSSGSGFGYWLLAGVAFGGSLLSKYYALLLAPSLLWFLILSPKYRFWLKRPQPWIAVVLALIVFSPVIIWNDQHEWASFAFQSTRTVGQKGTVPRRLGIFWLMQLGVLTPLGLALLAAAGWQAVKRGWLKQVDNWNFAASFGLPLFFLFVAASFKTDVHINWTAPAFLALLLPGSALWLAGLESGSEKCRRWWRVGTWTMAVLGGLILIAVHVSLATGKPERFAYSHANGWRELADSVRPLLQEQQAKDGQPPFIIGADKYNIAAELGFYLGQPADCVNGYAYGTRGVGYRYWTDLPQWKGRTALIILWGAKPEAMAKMLQTLGEHFDRLDAPRPLFVDSPGKNWKTVQIIIGHGYQPGRITSMRDASLD